MDDQTVNWQRIPRIAARVLAMGFTFLWGIRLLEHWNATNPDIAAMNPVAYWAIAILLTGLLAGLLVGWVKELIGGWMVLGFGGLYLVLSGHWRLWPLAFGTLLTGLIWANLGWINQPRATEPAKDPKPDPEEDATQARKPVVAPIPGPENARPSAPTDL